MEPPVDVSDPETTPTDTTSPVSPPVSPSELPVEPPLVESVVEPPAPRRSDRPFVDSDHFVHQYFLPLEYAIIIPVFAGVALLSLLSLFVGSVMLKSRKKNKKA
ncbi:unnamed protein product [Linum tenue]|uniref:Dolichol phosphate-mannose biosynthesis regulatory protein n=1 Tax=Linum tenue TaxID=586396 RepID=A0AAV0KB15_9ROSI|nr:unnamed protein product [Linum tenue]